jgi:choline dehydrogenase-like flavoprotein
MLEYKILLNRAYSGFFSCSLIVFNLMLINPLSERRNIDDSADAVVIGSGAGGAVVAKELAEGGMRVIIVEEGGSYTGKDFNRKPLDMFRLLYRDAGLTTVGVNPMIFLPLGRCLGGTTTINSGTCYRAPYYIIKKWQEEFGISDLTPENMERWYSKVEGIINVETVPDELLGKIGELIREGAKKLNYRAGNIPRNVKNCKGCGHCAFGCIQDAKQSTNLSYIPLAQKHGAKIYIHARAYRIITENGRAVGIEADIVEGNGRKTGLKLKVNAKHIFLACGALHTPAILLLNNMGNRHTGRHLRIHPSMRVSAIYNQVIRGWEGVPQSFHIHEFEDEGIFLQGQFVPPGVEAPMLPGIGIEHRTLMENYDKLASFGALISDESEGRVYVLSDGKPFANYKLKKKDFHKLLRAGAITADLFFASGAKKVFFPIYSFNTVNSPGELNKIYERVKKPNHIEMMAFHPMGTCRMSTDPDIGVVDINGEVYGCKNLFVCDASIFPTSTRINPQLTIMAMATRIAERMLGR